MADQSVNPYNGQTLETFEELTDSQLETKLATAAAACFQTWRKQSYTERAVIVARAAAIMHARVDDFAHAMTLEMGKRIGEARGEIAFGRGTAVRRDQRLGIRSRAR